MAKSLDPQTALNTTLALGGSFRNSSGNHLAKAKVAIPRLLRLWRIMESFGLGKSSEIIDSKP